MSISSTAHGAWLCSSKAGAALTHRMASTAPYTCAGPPTARQPHGPLARLAASGGAPSPGADVDVQELAEKAKLQVSPAEAAEFQVSLSRIVDWFGQIQAADVGSVQPSLRAAAFGEEAPQEATLRRDEPRVFEGHEEMLREAPLLEGRYLKLPRIVGEGVSG